MPINSHRRLGGFLHRKRVGIVPDPFFPVRLSKKKKAVWARDYCIYVRIAWLFFLSIYSRCGAMVSWAAWHTAVSCSYIIPSNCHCHKYQKWDQKALMNVTIMKIVLEWPCCIIIDWQIAITKFMLLNYAPINIKPHLPQVGQINHKFPTSRDNLESVAGCEFSFGN